MTSARLVAQWSSRFPNNIIFVQISWESIADDSYLASLDEVISQRASVISFQKRASAIVAPHPTGDASAATAATTVAATTTTTVATIT